MKTGVQAFAALLTYSDFNPSYNVEVRRSCVLPQLLHMVKSPIFGRRLTATSLCCLSGLFTLLSGTFNELGYCMLDSEDRFSDINVILGFIQGPFRVAERVILYKNIYIYMFFKGMFVSMYFWV